MALTYFSHTDMTLPEFGADFDTALQNYFRLAKKINLRDGFVCRQVHGRSILSADESQPERPLLPTIIGEGDAIWTSKRNAWVGVFTADCQAMLFDADERVMAVHSGWRGIAGGMIEEAVTFLEPAEIKKVILGPAAKSCCYEVGEEVIEGIRCAGVTPVINGRMLDIGETCRNELHRLGITTVEYSEPYGCTICDKRFRSYRRNGKNAGRSLALIARR